MTAEDLDQWARQAGTLAFEQRLEAAIQETKDIWAEQGYTSDTAEATMRLNTVALAQIAMLQQILQIVEDMRIKPILAGNEEEDSNE